MKRVATFGRAIAGALIGIVLGLCPFLALFALVFYVWAGLAAGDGAGAPIMFGPTLSLIGGPPLGILGGLLGRWLGYRSNRTDRRAFIWGGIGAAAGTLVGGLMGLSAGLFLMATAV